MNYGINISFLTQNTTMEKAAELVSNAGFTMLDYTPPVGNDNWREIMREHVKIFDANGLTVHQTHAPFDRYGQHKEKYQQRLERCAEATELMGAGFMVAHGDEFDIEHTKFSREAAFDYNYNLFLPYVERAEKNGYKVAFETVFEDGMPWGRYTSDIDELERLIRAYNCESAVCCWDFGHANVSFGKKAHDHIRRLSSLIQCTHLHDNMGNDAHQIPMTGEIDWKETMKAFHEIGYCGAMSIEYAHGCIPESLMSEFLNLSFGTAKHLWETEL